MFNVVFCILLCTYSCIILCILLCTYSYVILYTYSIFYNVLITFSDLVLEFLSNSINITNEIVLTPSFIFSKYKIN